MCSGIRRASGPLGREAASFATLRRRGDFGRKTKRQHQQRLTPIASDNEQVTPLEPMIELAEAVAAHLHLDGAVDAKYRHR
jgi:hypothetical protein